MDTDSIPAPAGKSSPKAAPSQRELLDALVGIAMKHANEQFMDCVGRLVVALQDVTDPGLEARAVHQRMKAGNVLKANSYAFFHLVSTGLELAIRKELDVLAPSLKAKAAASAASLTLVPYEEMDNKVAFGSLARPFEIKYSEELATLNVRLGLMLERDILRMGQNPFRPEVLLGAINQAWIEFEPDTESHPLLVQVLTPTTLFDCAPMYAELNGALQRKGRQPDSMDGYKIRKTKHAAAQKAAKAGSQEALAQQLRALFGEGGAGKTAPTAPASDFDIPLIPELPNVPAGEGGWRPSTAGAAFQTTAAVPAHGPATGAQPGAAVPGAARAGAASASAATGSPANSHAVAPGAQLGVPATAGGAAAPHFVGGVLQAGVPSGMAVPGGGAPVAGAHPGTVTASAHPGAAAVGVAPFPGFVAGAQQGSAAAGAQPYPGFVAGVADSAGLHGGFVAAPGGTQAGVGHPAAAGATAYPGFAPVGVGGGAPVFAVHPGSQTTTAIIPGIEVPVFSAALPAEAYMNLPAGITAERAPLFAYLSTLQPMVAGAASAAAFAADASSAGASGVVGTGAPGAGGTLGVHAAPGSSGADLASASGASGQPGPAVPGAAATAATAAGTAVPHNVVYLPQLKASMPQGALSRGDENTIDLLAKVFETVFRDPSIPGEIRDLINFLQIPVLKAALLDRNFFFQDAHPARRLIELLSRMGWEQRKAPDDPVFQAMRRSVDRVGRDFDAELDVFNQAVAELEASIEAQEQAAEQALAAPIAHALKQEKRAIAAKSAQEAVRVRIGTGEVVAVVETFLQHRWTSVMTLAYSIEDDKPGAVNNATKTMDDLIWSVKPKVTHEQRKDLISKLPGLIQRLNKWLDVIKWQDAERLQFFAELAECHASIVRAPIDLSPDRQLELAVEAAQKDALRRIEQEKAAEEAAARAEAELDDVELTVDSLERGMWVEFREDDDTVRKVKLAWVSPRRTLFIFSTGARQEAFSMPADKLTDALRDGKATLIGLEGVVGRALSEAVGQTAVNDPQHTAAA